MLPALVSEFFFPFVFYSLVEVLIVQSGPGICTWTSLRVRQPGQPTLICRIITDLTSKLSGAERKLPPSLRVNSTPTCCFLGSKQNKESRLCFISLFGLLRSTLSDHKQTWDQWTTLTVTLLCTGHSLVTWCPARLQSLVAKGRVETNEVVLCLLSAVSHLLQCSTAVRSLKLNSGGCRTSESSRCVRGTRKRPI